MIKRDLEYLVAVAIEEARISGKRELHLNGIPFIGLTEIPPAVFELSNLRLLNISGSYGETRTGIKEIPPEIAKLTDLETLILEKNQIEALPAELFTLTRLEHLYLKSNNIHSLPRLTANLKRIRKLDLSDNQLSELPSEIGELKDLETLDLTQNRLKRLPLEIGRLDKLLRLSLSSNKIENVPLEILNQSTSAIVNYCRSVLEEQTLHLYEAKLLIVGEGGVGKTCLLQRIAYDSFNSNELTTEGIDIHRWSFNNDNTEDFRINIWDFGGQEIYHATHQFFLTKRSLYMFVWTARSDEINFDYWLNVIRLLSDNSPVIVVLNKIDERVKMIDEAFIQQRFKNVIGFYRVSALNGNGISELVTRIKEEVGSLEHIGSVLPSVWVQIREVLERLNKNYISYRKYKSICATYGLNDTKVGFLSRYYHDLGVFLHFQDNSILKNIIFLKPEWATSAVYKLIDTKDVIRNFGKFHFNQLSDIWIEYPDEKHLHLVELMKKFELCFQIPNTEEYIIPELLQPSALDLNWNYVGNLRFEYHYDFMPSGIITRFIVINHHLIFEQCYWKNGVVLSREQTKALISSDPFNRRIQVWVDGPDKKELLSIIREKMDYIHTTLNQPTVREMVSCICNECKDRDPFFFDYSTLKRFYYKGRGYIACSQSAEDVLIEAVLGGIERLEKTAEEEILEILRKMKREDDTEQSLIKKANEIIQLKPSFMGVGININEIIAKLLNMSKKKQPRSVPTETEQLALPSGPEDEQHARTTTNLSDRKYLK